MDKTSAKLECFIRPASSKAKKFTANIWLKWKKFGAAAKVGGWGVYSCVIPCSPFHVLVLVTILCCSWLNSDDARLLSGSFVPVSNPQSVITHALSPASETSEAEMGDLSETAVFPSTDGLDITAADAWVRGDVEVTIAWLATVSPADWPLRNLLIALSVS